MKRGVTKLKASLQYPLNNQAPKGAAFDLVFLLFVSRISARSGEAPRRVNQAAQGRIDGLLVREVLGNIWREQHEIRFPR